MLICLTASHKNTDFPALEALVASDSPDLPIRLADVDGMTGVVVLATCNRFEIYADADDVASARSSADLALPGAGLLHALSGASAAEHLFGVASGLESVAVGENEIAGQVRRALQSARHAGTATATLERVFATAIEAQREIRRESGLDSTGSSIVKLGLDLACGDIDWSASRVLLVGTGRFAVATLEQLRRRGAHRIAVWSPSGRGSGFAYSQGVPVVGDESVAQELANADVIVTCSAARTYVVAPTDLPATRDRIVLDLGMPRNVDPTVRDVPGTSVVDLDDIGKHAPHGNLTSTAQAREAVRTWAEGYERSLTADLAGPAIGTMRTYVADALEAELARVRLRGTEAEQAAVEHALRHFAGALLHSPTIRARALASDPHLADVVAALFGPIPPLRASITRSDTG